MDGLNTVVKGMECYGEVDAIISSAVFGKKRGSTTNRKGRYSFYINDLSLCLARQFGSACSTRVRQMFAANFPSRS